jgi:formylmethanofuran dehydrogenase subunit C
VRPAGGKSIEAGTVTVEGDADALVAAVDDAGYEATA